MKPVLLHSMAPGCLALLAGKSVGHLEGGPVPISGPHVCFESVELKRAHGCALCCSRWLEGSERMKVPRLLRQETKLTDKGDGDDLQLQTGGQRYLFLGPQCTGPVVTDDAGAREG